jgi:hypothetical protein
MSGLQVCDGGKKDQWHKAAIQKLSCGIVMLFRVVVQSSQVPLIHNVTAAAKSVCSCQNVNYSSHGLSSALACLHRIQALEDLEIQGLSLPCAWSVLTLFVKGSGNETACFACDVTIVEYEISNLVSSRRSRKLLIHESPKAALSQCSHESERKRTRFMR